MILQNPQCYFGYPGVSYDTGSLFASAHRVVSVALVRYQGPVFRDMSWRPDGCSDWT